MSVAVVTVVVCRCCNDGVVVVADVVVVEARVFPPCCVGIEVYIVNVT